VEMIRDTILVPEKLQACMEGMETGRNDKHEHLARQLERFTARIAGIEAQKQRSIELYAADRLTDQAYIAENRNLDREIQRLHKRKAQIARELEAAAANDLVERSIREYCERTKERFAKCSAFDVTRQFLVDHIQRIIYLRSKVTILGSVPLKRGPFRSAAPVPFHIEGELDRKAIYAKPRKVLADDGRWKKLKETITEDVRPTATVNLDGPRTDVTTTVKKIQE